MPTPREHLAAAAFGGRLYVAAGRVGANTNAFESYDPASDRWTVLPAVPTGRSGLAAAILHGRMYVLGGEGNSATPTGVFEENESYDFASGTWRREPPMATPRHGIGAVTIGGRIYVPAGATVAGFGTVDTNEAFEDAPGRRRRAAVK
jgi:N-acetylneuraminic acid mutarotase